MKQKARLRVAVPSGAALLTASALSLFPATMAAAAPTTVSFNCTGGTQTFVIPADVSEISVDAFGAQGGAGYSNDFGGLGAEATAAMTVTPGESLEVDVGCKGADATLGGNALGGFNGGGTGGTGMSEGIGGAGGGGASDIRQGGTGLLNRVIVAGGGGGTGAEDHEPPQGDAGVGGIGGDLPGGDGLDGTCTPQHCAVGGKGGTEVAGGPGGGGYTPSDDGVDGALGVGGTGGSCGTVPAEVGPSPGACGGGGGGGYFGGGGGGGTEFGNGFGLGFGGGGGGGGSGFGPAGVVFADEVQQGDGRVDITFTPGPSVTTSTVSTPTVVSTTTTTPGSVDLGSSSAANAAPVVATPRFTG